MQDKAQSDLHPGKNISRRPAYFRASLKSRSPGPHDASDIQCGAAERERGSFRKLLQASVSGNGTGTDRRFVAAPPVIPSSEITIVPLRSNPAGRHPRAGLLRPDGLAMTAPHQAPARATPRPVPHPGVIARCESAEAIQTKHSRAGLLRSARNDGPASTKNREHKVRRLRAH
jgi:hypothetical protein